MRLPHAPADYSRVTEEQRNRAIEQADRMNHKRGQDVEIGMGRLILTSPNGTRYQITVANDGTVSSSAV